MYVHWSQTRNQKYINHNSIHFIQRWQICKTQRLHAFSLNVHIYSIPHFTIIPGKAWSKFICCTIFLVKLDIIFNPIHSIVIFSKGRWKSLTTSNFGNFRKDSATLWTTIGTFLNVVTALRQMTSRVSWALFTMATPNNN